MSNLHLNTNYLIKLLIILESIPAIKRANNISIYKNRKRRKSIFFFCQNPQFPDHRQMNGVWLGHYNTNTRHNYSQLTSQVNVTTQMKHVQYNLHGVICNLTNGRQM